MNSACDFSRRPERLLVVSPRPPRSDGQGDQRRAHELVSALATTWPVDVVSWLPEAGEGRGTDRVSSPAALARAALLAPRRPATVAYVQSWAPRSLASTVEDYDLVFYVTDRAVPTRPGAQQRAVIDFVDDLGGAALRRADSARTALRWFWKWEGRRLRTFDRRLSASAGAAVAHSDADAAGLGQRVRTIPLAAGTGPLPCGDKIAFLGNLFYAPNHEAGTWICNELVPALADAGITADKVVVAGRSPRPTLQADAARAGVDFRPDVADLTRVLADAAVVLSPTVLGSGSQYKVIDAVAAGRPVVLTGRANDGLGLVDGQSALVRERKADAFAEAIVSLLSDADLSRRLVDGARSQLAAHLPDAVACAWRSLVADVLAAIGPREARR